MSNEEDIFGMEMPCLCGCGEWFDLNDGYASDKRNITVCRSCFDKEILETEIEEEIEDLRSSISDAEFSIREAKKRLKELGVEI